jgi:hypothetical protein
MRCVHLHGIARIKHIRGYVISWVGNIMDEESRAFEETPVWLFWFPFHVGSRVWWHLNDRSRPASLLHGDSATEMFWYRLFFFQTCCMSWAWKICLEVAGQCLQLRCLPEGRWRTATNALFFNPYTPYIRYLSQCTQPNLLPFYWEQAGLNTDSGGKERVVYVNCHEMAVTTSNNNRLSALNNNCFFNRDISFEEGEV